MGWPSFPMRSSFDFECVAQNFMVQRRLRGSFTCLRGFKVFRVCWHRLNRALCSPINSAQTTSHLLNYLLNRYNNNNRHSGTSLRTWHSLAVSDLTISHYPSLLSFAYKQAHSLITQVRHVSITRAFLSNARDNPFR